jgi:hypothetical protein
MRGTLRRRLRLPLPWAVAIVAAVTVGVFALAWLSGSPIWVVALATLAAALVAGGSLTVTGPLLGNRTFRVIAHALLGAFVLVVASFATLLSAAAGALTPSLVNVVLFGSLWGLGAALLLAGAAVLFEADRVLRVVAGAGLALTALWGVVALAVLGDLVAGILLEGLDVSLLQDLRDDLPPFLVVLVALVVLPALVFRRDLRGLRSEDTSEE